MQHANPRVTRRDLVGKLARAVGRSVVDDEYVVTEVPDADDDLLEVLTFVVGRQDSEHLRWCGLAFGEVAGRAHFWNRILSTCQNMSAELRIALTLVGAELRHITGTSAIRTPCLLA